ncbi:hypothetical protein [Pengzhenrongella sp.]|uniref:hypothetical protein n=1 Tax=Pengzhenrongella sp. TaxID=2888820 RepID=UPI002F928D94
MLDGRPGRCLSATVVAALIVAGLAGCGATPGAGTGSTQTRFAALVEAAGKGDKTVAMTSVTHFDWDHGVAVCPRDSVDAVEKLLGAKWPDAPRAADDGVAYVLFAGGDRVVDSIRIKRSAIDPCAGRVPLAKRAFGPTGVFRVSAATGGTGWMLTPVG